MDMEHVTVLRALVGSHNYNLNTAKSDKDYKLFCLPSFNDLYYGKMYSTSHQSEEVDYDIHDIRQLSNLLWKSNLNFVEVLFSKDAIYDDELKFLFGQKNKWATMNIPTFRNSVYGMHLEKMKGLLKGTSTTQPDVIRFGYDPKQACHALRCLYVLEKFLETGDMGEALWFNDGEKRNTLLKVKAGEYTLEEFKELVEHWHNYKYGSVMKSYNDAKIDLNAKDELETLMFEYIKSKVLSLPDGEWNDPRLYG